MTAQTCETRGYFNFGLTVMKALRPGISDNKQVEKLQDRIFQLTNRPDNGLGPYANNLTVHKFNANHHSIMLDKAHLKRVVKIIEKDMNKKISALGGFKKTNKMGKKKKG